MKLRELIDRLEQLSHNGKNDNLDVEVWDSNSQCFIDNNQVCDPIKRAWINTYISSNDEYDYVMIEI